MSLDKINSGVVKDIIINKPVQKKVKKVKVPVEKKSTNKPVPDRKKIEIALQSFQTTRFSYKITDELNRFIVKIIDKDTDKVIRQIPSEELQKLHENLKEALGILFDQEI